MFHFEVNGRIQGGTSIKSPVPLFLPPAVFFGPQTPPPQAHVLFTQAPGADTTTDGSPAGSQNSSLFFSPKRQPAPHSDPFPSASSAGFRGGGKRCPFSIFFICLFSAHSKILRKHAHSRLSPLICALVLQFCPNLVKKISMTSDFFPARFSVFSPTRFFGFFLFFCVFFTHWGNFLLPRNFNFFTTKNSMTIRKQPCQV